MNRLTMHPAVLPSGIIVPAGYKVSVDLKAIHFNPDIYPNPDVFDPFRFSRLRDDQEGGVEWGFTTVDRHVSGVFLDIRWGYSDIHVQYLPFGIGTVCGIHPYQRITHLDLAMQVATHVPVDFLLP